MKRKSRANSRARLFLAVVVTNIFLRHANDCGIIWHMIGLTDVQLGMVMQAARLVPVENRDTFLQRIAAMLAIRGRGRFTDTDVADVAQVAMAGLVQTRRRGVIGMGFNR